MTVVEVDFARERRNREVFLVAVAQAIVETFNEPPEWGPTTPADMLRCEAECQEEDPEAILSLYHHAVAYLNTPLDGSRCDVALDDPRCHTRAVDWAKAYLGELNEAHGLKLGEVPP